MKRKLGKIETAAALSGEHAVFNIVGVLHLEGLPSAELVRRALDKIQDRHPFLKVGLIKEGRSRYFVSGDLPPIPMHVIDREGDEHWVKIAEEYLNSKFDHPNGPLMKCAYIADGSKNQGEIILSAQHSIVDGVTVENLLHELLDLCMLLETGDEITDFDPLPPLAPMETYFPVTFKGFRLTAKTLSYFLGQMADEFKYQVDLRGKRKPPVDTRAQGKIVLIHTPKDTTSRLVERSRKERVTLNAVVNAAVLLGVQKQLYSGEEMPYRYMVMADLRPYLQPVPPANEMGCFFSPLRYTVRIPSGENLWILARKINDQIYQSTKGGEKYLASLMAEQFMRMTFGLKRFRMSTTATSYGGSSTCTRMEYGPYKIRAVHGFVSNFGLGPEFSGRVGLYDGELWWDMLYMDSDMDHEKAKIICCEIDEILSTAIDG